MKPCATRGRDVTRGSTSGKHGDATCLVCATARLFATWRYVPRDRSEQTRRKYERRKLRQWKGGARQ